MTKDERWYFLERARTSLEAGQRAIDPAVASVHLDLYERYMTLAARPIGPDLALRVVSRQQ